MATKDVKFAGGSLLITTGALVTEKAEAKTPGTAPQGADLGY
ncbi:hypothetical protein [Gluconacetobacter aggeris]|nr:hypothetical protein [Gluconacetobacter aggeris]